MTGNNFLHSRVPANGAISPPDGSQPADLRVWRERMSWEAAAAWLNREGLAAAVPAELVPVLERRGYVVWAAGRAA